MVRVRVFPENQSGLRIGDKETDLENELTCVVYVGGERGEDLGMRAEERIKGGFGDS